MEARDIMSSPVITISTHGTVEQAADLMLAGHVSCLPVVDAEGNLESIITATDYILHPKMMFMGGHLYTVLGETATAHDLEDIARQVRQKAVRDLAHPDMVTIQEDTPVEDAMAVMLEKKVHHLPVLSGKKLTGIITQHDFLKLYLPRSGRGA